MAADWYFLKKGWLNSKKRAGPVSEAELLTKVSSGEIQPDTLLQSESKTKGRWVKMSEIPPALERWQQLNGKVG